MGYATRYALTISGADDAALAAIHAALLRLDGPSDALGLDARDEPDTEYGCELPCKWYDHVADMRAVSAQFPGVLFTLTGKGQSPGDLWIRYFRDGLCQSAPAHITYDAFDPAKLS